MRAFVNSSVAFHSYFHAQLTLFNLLLHFSLNKSYSCSRFPIHYGYLSKKLYLIYIHTSRFSPFQMVFELRIRKRIILFHVECFFFCGRERKHNLAGKSGIPAIHPMEVSSIENIW